jgi:hypothetical protein
MFIIDKHNNLRVQDIKINIYYFLYYLRFIILETENASKIKFIQRIYSPSQEKF